MNEKFQRMVREMFPECSEAYLGDRDDCPLCKQMGMDQPGMKTVQIGPLTLTIKEVRPN